MADQPGTTEPMPDLGELSTTLTEIAERSQRLVTDFLRRQATHNDLGIRDPLSLGNAFMDMTTAMIESPARLAKAQVSLWQDYMSLWQSAASRLLGQPAGPDTADDTTDRRFRDERWQDVWVFTFIKQSYLLTARWLLNTVRAVEGLDRRTVERLDFYIRQFIDALSPANFLVTNPDVLRLTLDSGGGNLLNGLTNLLADLESGSGRLRFGIAQMPGFRVGHDVAATAGQVVHRNDLMELIQYAPTTAKVRQRPLLVVPPWINKYYVLDLRPETSFVKWCVDRGHTVFMISWVNPDPQVAAKSFDDYLTTGVVEAVDVIEDITGERAVNAVGYWVGGTLLAAALAYMTARKDRRVASVTLLTTMLDFEEPGELGIFIDEETISHLEQRLAERGYVEGAKMASTYNMLRANDLIWSFVLNNFLLGRDPFPFDLFSWNADSTLMPAALHTFYLRHLYQDNRLVEPGGVTAAGVPLDLSRIKVPVYVLSARDDHIAPWRSTHRATGIFSGPVEFVLTASGHVGGVVNPPGSGKYGHWTNPEAAANADAWLAGATRHEGSWWPHWESWLRGAGRGRASVPARPPGGGSHPPLGDAPGTYVLRHT